MNYKLKKLGQALSPPILLSGTKALGRFIRKRDEKPSERSPDWYDRAFSRTVETHKHYTESKHYFLWSIIAHLMARDGVRSVLDVGCGSGQLALLLLDKGIKEYCGIDFSQKRIEWARKNCPGFTFIVDDVLRTNMFSTFPYDAVVCAEFLDHVQADIEMIQRIKTGARFYAIVPNFSYSSHVRYFKDPGEVVERYAAYFKEFRVSPFSADRKGKTYFLLEGIKR
jgi:2-polyprenyl-3-methyl-5-hydroxy-6-metoxy-1,4-benzoquinol methylase